MQAVLLFLALGGAVQAEGWAKFYVSSQGPVASAPARSHAAQGNATGLCIREILSAQTRHGIPDNLLLAIGLQEAGTRRNGHFTVWPFAVNAAGAGRLFDTRTAALAWVEEQRRAGVRSIDVGCMQINLRWHPEAFATIDEGFDPYANVDYAARFLKRLHRQTGDWMQAAGAYHSFEPVYRDAYLERLKKNIAAANVRLPDFTALASATGGRSTRPKTAPAARSSGDTVQVARATWGALLGGENNARMSLYSAHEIQPLLPQFTTVRSESAG